MYRNKEVHQIVAHDLNLAIGYEGELLCRIKEDLRSFKKATYGHSLIAGRKTALGLPPLEGRIITVASHKMGITWALEEAYRYAELLHQDRIYIIGGGEIYKAALPITDMIHATVILDVFTAADTFMPDYRKDFTQAFDGVTQYDSPSYKEFKFTKWVANPK